MALSEPAEYGLPDFILVEEISEKGFMENFKQRYQKGKVGETNEFSAILQRSISIMLTCRFTRTLERWWYL